MWFTSDTHFRHANIIKYCNRPFESVKEMDETLIENWNKVVGPKDTVWHLGDFMFERRSPDKIKEYADRLNGKIHLILGNHDQFHLCRGAGCFESINEQRQIKHEGQKITLNHYSMRVWNCSHHGAWQLYGHSHGSLPDIGGLTFDVGVDAQEYRPVHFDEIAKAMKTREKVMLWSDYHHTRTIPTVTSFPEAIIKAVTDMPNEYKRILSDNFDEIG